MIFRESSGKNETGDQEADEDHQRRGGGLKRRGAMQLHEDPSLDAGTPIEVLLGEFPLGGGDDGAGVALRGQPPGLSIASVSIHSPTLTDGSRRCVRLSAVPAWSGTGAWIFRARRDAA